MKDTGDSLKYKTSTKSKIASIAVVVGWYLILYGAIIPGSIWFYDLALWEYGGDSDILVIGIGLIALVFVAMAYPANVFLFSSTVLITGYLLPINTRLVSWIVLVYYSISVLFVHSTAIDAGIYDIWLMMDGITIMVGIFLGFAIVYKKPPYRLVLKLSPISRILDTLLNHTSIAPHLPKEVSRKISEIKRRVMEEELALGIRLPQNSPTQRDDTVTLVDHNTGDEDADKAERLENAYQELLTDHDHDLDPFPLPLEQSSVTVESTGAVLILRCLTCGHVYSGSDKFCSECGGALHILCPSCRNANLQDNQFCGKCGANLKSA